MRLDGVPDWFPDWSGGVCALVASGSSAKRENVEHLRGKCRVVVINNSFLLVPWADAIYAADGKWWATFKGVPHFDGMKIATDEVVATRYRLKLVKLVRQDDVNRHRISMVSGVLGRGGNSAFQALNWMIQCGARRIIGIGLDFCGEHWHGRHPDGMKNPREATLREWATILDGQAELLESLGVEFVNTSAISILTEYPKMDIETALSRWTEQSRVAA